MVRGGNESEGVGVSSMDWLTDFVTGPVPLNVYVVEIEFAALKLLVEDAGGVNVGAGVMVARIVVVGELRSVRVALGFRLRVIECSTDDVFVGEGMRVGVGNIDTERDAEKTEENESVSVNVRNAVRVIVKDADRRSVSCWVCVGVALTVSVTDIVPEDMGCEKVLVGESTSLSVCVSDKVNVAVELTDQESVAVTFSDSDCVCVGTSVRLLDREIVSA